MMKKTVLFLTLTLISLASCNKDNIQYENYKLATPITKTLDEIRAEVEIKSPEPIVKTGKIYTYFKIIFVNEIGKGVHVINNSNPVSPQKIAFLKIPGNVDISIKDNYLYADSYVDLVVFDVSDFNNITYVNRLEKVFPSQLYNYPEGVDAVNLEGVNYNNEVIVDWVITEETRPVVGIYEDTIETNSGGGDVGTGGSLARFKIVSDYLYVVDYNDLHVFNISNLSNPQELETQHVGWNIETIFNQGAYLYLGSSSGMYIYSIENPQSPQYYSQINHIDGCDPVVVKGDYAYVTIRGGNVCGQDLSELNVINISNKYNPILEATIPMEEPYGLGVHENQLFVSDGAFGLKIFNIEVPNQISLEHTYSDLHIFDVIPLEEELLLIGDNTLYQYHYLDDGIDLISAYTFQ